MCHTLNAFHFVKCLKINLFNALTILKQCLHKNWNRRRQTPFVDPWISSSRRMQQMTQSQKTDAEMIRSTHPWNTLLFKKTEVLWNNVSPCRRVNDEYLLKKCFFERVSDQILHSMSWLWVWTRSAQLDDLESHAKLFKVKLQGSYNTLHAS